MNPDCRGCIAATKRIAELESRLAVNHKMWGGNRTWAGAMAQSALVRVADRQTYPQGLDGLPRLAPLRTSRAASVATDCLASYSIMTQIYAQLARSVCLRYPTPTLRDGVKDAYSLPMAAERVDMSTTGFITRLTLFAILSMPIFNPTGWAAPATKPTIKSGASEGVAAGEEPEALTERQQSLLLQLSDAEVNIRAINQALRQTGYKVGLAYDRIEGSQKGNEIMDRKGGGPVGWKDFYGKTAREVNDSGGRPKIFDRIYKANNDQAVRAKEQISNLAKDQAGLLARRQKHEADEGRLWAMLAWERVGDREISFRPLYRFRLKPAGAQAELLRGPILFLRTADKAVAEAMETVESDPAGTFSALNQRVKAGYAALQESTADSLNARGLTPEQRHEGEALKAMCKRLAEECAVVTDNYEKALDSDKAKEDGSKLEFRGQLQTLLMKFAAGVAELDERLQKAAAGWKVVAESGTASPDQVPAAPISPKALGRQPKNGLPEPAAGADLFQPGTVWSQGGKKLTVLDRRGDTFRARFEQPNIVREFSGTATNGEVIWLAKDVHAIRGGAGGDNHGTVHGTTIDFVYNDQTGHLKSFSLSLAPPPK